MNINTEIIAVEIGRRFHEAVQLLYISQHGKVVYGHGGQEAHKWRQPYRTGDRPQKWRNGGVEIVGRWIAFGNYLGKTVCRIPRPPMSRVTFECCEPCDLYGIAKPYGLVERWAMDPNGIMVVSGYGRRPCRRTTARRRRETATVGGAE